MTQKSVRKWVHAPLTHPVLILWCTLAQLTAACTPSPAGCLWSWVLFYCRRNKLDVPGHCQPWGQLSQWLRDVDVYTAQPLICGWKNSELSSILYPKGPRRVSPITPIGNWLMTPLALAALPSLSVSLALLVCPGLTSQINYMYQILISASASKRTKSESRDLVITARNEWLPRVCLHCTSCLYITINYSQLTCVLETDR